MAFFFEVLITGLMVGIMYSLVALGFALIFKASDVFNMAQGAMSLFAALALYGFWNSICISRYGLPSSAPWPP